MIKLKTAAKGLAALAAIVAALLVGTNTVPVSLPAQFAIRPPGSVNVGAPLVPTPGFPMNCEATITASGGVFTATQFQDAWTAAPTGRTSANPYEICAGTGTYTGGNIQLSGARDYVTFVGGGGNPTISGLPKNCATDATGCPQETILDGGYFLPNGSTIVGLRVVGFKITTNTNQWQPGTSNWRIDHNWFINANRAALINCISPISANGPFSYGLVDHNFLDDCQIEGAQDFSNTAGKNLRWAEANPIGTALQLVVEDNWLYRPTPTTGFWNCIDANQGNSYTFRFNTLEGCRVEAHGILAAEQRGTRLEEVYNNLITGGNNNRWALLRSGVQIVWGNVFSKASHNNRDIHIDVQRDYDTCPGCVVGSTWDLCDGTRTVDGNDSGGEGFPCLDQIGMIRDTTNWGATFGLPKPGTQERYGSYFWDNYDNDNGGAIMNIAKNCPASVCSSTAITRHNTKHVANNVSYWHHTLSFDGSSGMGVGDLSARPTSCVTGVAYFARDQGSWNQSTSNPAGNQKNGEDGIMYKCISGDGAGGAADTWDVWYTPLGYPSARQSY